MSEEIPTNIFCRCPGCDEEVRALRAQVAELEAHSVRMENELSEAKKGLAAARKALDCRAGRLMLKAIPFFVVKASEPYAARVAALIRAHEGNKWTVRDEEWAKSVLPPQALDLYCPECGSLYPRDDGFIEKWVHDRECPGTPPTEVIVSAALSGSDAMGVDGDGK